MNRGRAIRSSRGILQSPLSGLSIVFIPVSFENKRSVSLLPKMVSRTSVLASCGRILEEVLDTLRIPRNNQVIGLRSVRSNSL